MVSKMLGHSGRNMTRKYARDTDDLGNRNMQKLIGNDYQLMPN